MSISEYTTSSLRNSKRKSNNVPIVETADKLSWTYNVCSELVQIMIEIHNKLRNDPNKNSDHIFRDIQNEIGLYRPTGSKFNKLYFDIVSKYELDRHEMEDQFFKPNMELVINNLLSYLWSNPDIVLRHTSHIANENDIATVNFHMSSFIQDLNRRTKHISLINKRNKDIWHTRIYGKTNTSYTDAPCISDMQMPIRTDQIIEEVDSQEIPSSKNDNDVTDSFHVMNPEPHFTEVVETMAERNTGYGNIVNNYAPKSQSIQLGKSIIDDLFDDDE